MIKSVEIEGFKGIKSGKIADCEQINILTGKNNSGKSAFLQALYFLNEGRVAALIPSFDQKEMFWAYDNNQPIKYQISFNKNKFNLIYSLQINKRIWIDVENHLKDEKYFYQKIVRDKNLFKYINRDFNNIWSITEGGLGVTDVKQYLKDDIIEFINTINSSLLFSHLNFLRTSETLSGSLDKLQNTLHLEDNFLKILSETYEKNLTKLRHSPHEFEGWSVFLEDGSESRSISFDDLGDGARTAINILLYLFVEKPKIVLIDEIELHQHTKALYNLCKTILLYIKDHKAQLFVSTHNLDAIKIFTELSNQHKVSAAIQHFILKEGNLTARTIPSLDAETILDLTGDIRFIDEYV